VTGSLTPFVMTLPRSPDRRRGDRAAPMLRRKKLTVLGRR
jgi:hypothetical protein